ncbi:hypothetical protein ACSX1A_03265 [Pontibacter sp. MBLB2868]|uniref:hypothetical protein n=1 Tax=Pontibacter sp. MBLB2868 TaxID=3451555 RepID=UPI003F751C95
MNNLNFKKLLFKTAFSCTACDGHIDTREIEIIKQINKEEELVKEDSVQNELNKLIDELNNQGHDFLKQYLKELSETVLNDEEELAIINTAVRTINADESVEYSEISFFKLIRSKVSLSDETILDALPDIEEYLEKDVISKSYSVDLKTQFFSTSTFPQFELLDGI